MAVIDFCLCGDTKLQGATTDLNPDYVFLFLY